MLAIEKGESEKCLQISVATNALALLFVLLLILLSLLQLNSFIILRSVERPSFALALQNVFTMLKSFFFSFSVFVVVVALIFKLLSESVCSSLVDVCYRCCVVCYSYRFFVCYYRHYRILTFRIFAQSSLAGLTVVIILLLLFVSLCLCVPIYFFFIFFSLSLFLRGWVSKLMHNIH